MIEWNLFYRMLDIPEDVTEPTFYDLLGLHPDTCRAELVDRMLEVQKSRLRQNIPGPQFIPLVSSFEQKKLEHAAAILRNPKTRQQYDEHLRRKADQRRREDRNERARRYLLRQAREIVNSLLNPDKTLGDRERPILAAKLREIGIGESTINSLLEKIPRPANRAVKPGAEAKEYFVAAIDMAIRGNLLTPEAERTIMDLARRLNIDDEQALDRIDEELKGRNARRGRRNVSALQREFESRVCSMVPDGSATAEQYEFLLALARADNLPEALAREVLRRSLTVTAHPAPADQEELSESGESIHEGEPAGSVVCENQPEKTDQSAETRQQIRRRRKVLPIALIIIVIACFSFVVCFLEMGNREYPRRDKSPTSETSSVEGQSESAEGQEKSGTAAGRERIVSERGGPDAGRLETQEVYESFGQEQEQQEHRITSSTAPGAPAQLIVTAEDLRRVYSNSTRTEDLLAEVAMTMLACSCRATHFALGTTDCYDELRRQMNEPGRLSYLAEAVTVVPMSPVPAEAQSAPPEPEKSKSRTSRARGQSTPDPIEQLRMEDTAEAADRLLGSLKKRSLRSPGRIEMVCRILRALSTMTDSNIPHRLIEMLPGSSPEVAFQITRTLARASGTGTSYGRLTSGLLPLANKPVQRQKCAEWWKNNCPTWGRARPVRSAPVKTPAWEPDPTIIKLLAMTAHYAEITADVLKNYNWQAPIPMQSQGFGTSRFFGVTCSASDVGTTLLDSLDNIYSELSRIITEHPDDTKSAAMVDTIILHEKDPRTAACESQLQKVVVNLDTIAELLIVLVRQTDPNDELKETLAEIQEERNRALSRAFNVVYELRESCYYNLVLWDKLIERTIDAAIPAPRRMPAGRIRQ